MSIFHKNTIYHSEDAWAAEQAKSEIEQGLQLLSGITEDIVAFSGSARVTKDDYFYQHCQDVARTLGKKGYALLSGGGPGIMTAVNTGATQVGARSIGLKSELLTKEQVAANIYTDKLSHHYFFTRRFIMLIKTNVYIYYPGGLGTLNELLENMMLMQNGIVDTIPMICVGRKYWAGLFDWMKVNPVAHTYMDNLDLNLVQLMDDKDEIVQTVLRS